MNQGQDPHHQSSMYERNLDDSEDSDGEGGLGNLNRMVMRPAGHSGKAKKGHLCFDASFESGNLGRVDLISEFEYDLYIRPDTCCPKLRMWFNFMVDNVKQDQRVIFNIVNFGKSRNLYNTDMTPIVKSSSKPKWQRIMRRNVFYHRSIYHRFRHILSFAFAFDKEEDVYHFAMAIPYTYSKLQAYLDVWMRKSKHLKNAVDKTVIGKSIQKRNIDLITIGDEETNEDKADDKKKNEKRHVVIILARVHGGETPTSYVCQGLMDFMISSHSMAQLLRQNVTLKIIPMLNPDGVHLGNQRTNLLGMDLNRSWHMISQWAHPTLKVAYDVIKDTEAKREKYQLDFIIDIHAHSSLKGCFIYGNTYDDVYRYERHIVFPKIFAAKAEGYCGDNSFFNADSLKMGTARRFFCTSLGKNTNSFTLQVSMGGYHLPNLPHYIHYNEESYLRLGRNIGKSLYEYYRQINLIPAPCKVSENKSKHSKRKARNTRIKHIRPKTPHPSPAQQCIEPRLISPSIIRPECSYDYQNLNKNQETPLEYPLSHSKLSSKRVTINQKFISTPEDEAEKTYIPSTRPITSSPPQKLAIIDLNNIIRNGLKNSYSKVTFKSKFSLAERRSAKKKKFLKQKQSVILSTREMFSSDEDYIDID